jgi:hypothetical protein
MRTTLVAFLPLALVTGCDAAGEMSGLEALAALGSVDQSARGEQATTEVVEVSTDFTIGDALESAAQAIADFWQSQAPCTEVTLAGNVLTVDYGTLDDACSWNGRTYAGVNSLTFASTTPGELEVLHDWSGFSDGEVTVDGGATVTWSGEDQTRRVQTEHTWTAVDDGATVDVVGDHVTGPIDASVPWWQSGFTLDGDRAWTLDGDEWSLVMNGLEWRLVDAAPELGSIDVVAPNGKTLSIVYARVDEGTISATLVGVRGGDRVYHINQLGIPSEAE